MNKITPRKTRTRQGITSLLAMMYLVIFAALACGFYATTSTAIQVVHNERGATQAQAASESGTEFIRYQVDDYLVEHSEDQDQAWSELCTHLRNSLVGTGNLGSNGIYANSEMIRIPANPDAYIRLDNSGALFQATIENLGQKIRVKSVGKYGNQIVRRAIQIDFALAQKASQIFDYGVVTRGPLYTGGSSRIRGATDPKKGSILSTSLAANPVQIYGKEVSGDISIVNPTGNVTYGAGAHIGGQTTAAGIAAHIHKGVPAPEFPTIDTDVFKPYVMLSDGITPNYYTSGDVLDNKVIKAGTNPKFTSDVVINGVLYVETPNKIEFAGGATINGVIVVQNDPTGDITTNTLDFRGNVSANPVSSLPESFGDLRQLTGSFILAPTFSVTMSGSFGTINGSILADKISMTGSAGGTIMGSVIGLAEHQMNVNGSAEITIASTGTTNYPAGVYFSRHFVPLQDTYEEVLP